MYEITLQVARDEESGWLVASWDAPDNTGGITTQSEDLRDLQAAIAENGNEPLIPWEQAKIELDLG